MRANNSKKSVILLLFAPERAESLHFTVSQRKMTQ